MDMHDHIRTIILRNLFKIFGVPVVVFEKGRSEKHAFTRKVNKRTVPLPHTVERYRLAFEKAGFPLSINNAPYFSITEKVTDQVTEWLQKNNLSKKEKWIGIAPFAMHISKIWPLQNYTHVIEQLIQKSPVKFFLFGGGEKDIKFFETLKQKFPDHCVIVAGELKMKQELAVIVATGFDALCRFFQHASGIFNGDSATLHLGRNTSGCWFWSLWKRRGEYNSNQS